MRDLTFKLIIIFIATLLSIYSLEIMLSFWNNSSLKAKKWDKYNLSRYSVYNNLKEKNPNLALTTSPTTYLKNDNYGLLPLSGISNILTLNCNELGYWSKYVSDRYGFNNPNDSWDKEEIKYLIIGDSFVHGDCVNKPDDLSNQLRLKIKDNFGVLNLGYEGNGPLLEYATLKEYFPNKKVHNVLIFFAGANDLIELIIEKENKILKEYLVNDSFTQDLINKQKIIDQISLNKINEALKKYENDKKRIIYFDQIKFKNILYLKNLRHRLMWAFGINIVFKKETEIPFSKELLTMLEKTKEFVKNKGSKLYFIYLPDYPGDYDGFKTLDRLSYLKIPIINIQHEVFKKHKDPLSLFPFRKRGHYTPEGYKLIAEKVFDLTKN